MPRTTNDMLLQAIEKVDDKVSSHGERLASIETHIKTLVGNGQPGRITILEEDVKALQKSKWRQTGFLAALSIIFTPIVSWVLHRLGLA